MKILPNNKGVLPKEPDYFGEKSFLSGAINVFPDLTNDPTVEPASGVHIVVSALERST